MCDMNVDVAAVAATHHLPPQSLRPDPDRLAPLLGDGLPRWDGQRLTATEIGRPFLRCLAALFDAYLTTTTGRHARAV